MEALTYFDQTHNWDRPGIEWNRKRREAVIRKEKNYGCGFDFQDRRHRDSGGGAEPAAGALRPGGAGHDDHAGGS